MQSTFTVDATTGTVQGRVVRAVSTTVVHRGLPGSPQVIIEARATCHPGGYRTVWDVDETLRRDVTAGDPVALTPRGEEPTRDRAHANVSIRLQRYQAAGWIQLGKSMIPQQALAVVSYDAIVHGSTPMVTHVLDANAQTAVGAHEQCLLTRGCRFVRLQVGTTGHLHLQDRDPMAGAGVSSEIHIDAQALAPFAYLPTLTQVDLAIAPCPWSWTGVIPEQSRPRDLPGHMPLVLDVVQIGTDDTVGERPAPARRLVFDRVVATMVPPDLPAIRHVPWMQRAAIVRAREAGLLQSAFDGTVERDRSDRFIRRWFDPQQLAWRNAGGVP